MYTPPGPGHVHTCVVQGSEDPELVHGVEHVVLRGRVHEVELQQVLHAQGLEQQHHVGQVGPLYLGHGGGQQLILVSTLRVEPAREEPVTRLHLPRASLPASHVLATLRDHSAECQWELFQPHKCDPDQPTNPPSRDVTGPLICLACLLTFALLPEPPTACGGQSVRD